MSASAAGRGTPEYRIAVLQTEERRGESAACLTETENTVAEVRTVHSVQRSWSCLLQVVFPTSQFSPGFLAVIPVDLSLVTGQQLVQSPRRSVSVRDYIKRSNAKFGTGGG